MTEPAAAGRDEQYDLTDILAELEAMDLKVYNLFQLPTGVWQANVGDRREASEFARAAFPVWALVRAKLAWQQRHRVPLRVQISRAIFDPAKPPSVEDLGL